MNYFVKTLDFSTQLTMDTTSDWFYTSIQQKRTLGMLASAFEITKSLEDLGLGSWESIEKGSH